MLLTNETTDELPQSYWQERGDSTVIHLLLLPQKINLAALLQHS